MKDERTHEELKHTLVSFIGHHEYAIVMCDIENAKLMPSKKMRSLVDELVTDGTIMSDKRCGRRYIWLPGMKLPQTLENKHKEFEILRLVTNQAMTRKRICDSSDIDIVEVRKLVSSLVQRAYLYCRTSGHITITTGGRAYLNNYNKTEESVQIDIKPEGISFSEMINSLCTTTSSPVISSGTYLNASI